LNFTQKDRDMLIKHDIKLAQVCKTLTSMDEKFDKKFDNLNDKMDNNVKTYITRRMFIWVNGIIIAGIIILGGYMSTINNKVNDVNTQVTKNTVCIQKLEGK